MHPVSRTAVDLSIWKTDKFKQKSPKIASIKHFDWPRGNLSELGQQKNQKLECLPARSWENGRWHGCKVMIGSAVIVHCDSLEKNSFYRNPRADQACGFFWTLRNAGVLAFPRGDELTIENHFGDSIMTFCCIAAIVYEFSHITSLRKSPSG